MTSKSMSRLRSVCFLALVSCVTAVPSVAGESLFPRPIHLTREIIDPVASKKTVVEEYCEGNRVVTVNGDATVIVDYARQELTEIDRRAGTYSITPFSEIARNAPAGVDRAVQSDALETEALSVTAGKPASSFGRPVESFEISRPKGADRKVRISVDRGITISRPALEVLLGAAYPASVTAEHRAMIEVARVPRSNRIRNDSDGSAEPSEVYGLPVEQQLEVEWDGTISRAMSVVVRVGDEPAPPAYLAILPGTRLVESRVTAIRRGLEELDRLPGRGNR